MIDRATAGTAGVSFLVAAIITFFSRGQWFDGYASRSEMADSDKAIWFVGLWCLIGVTMTLVRRWWRWREGPAK